MVGTDAQYTLLATPTMAGLKQEVLEAMPAGLFRDGNVKWASFSDGTPNLVIDIPSVENKDVVLLAEYDMRTPGKDWVATLGVIYSLPRYRVRSLTVVLPFFPMGTMERVSEEGEVATAMTFARMLSATPLTVNGPPCFAFFDIHALQSRFYFSDQVLPLLVTGIPLLKTKIEALRQDGENVAIAFPDDGAKKRFLPMFGSTDLPVIVCSKTRDEGKRVLKITEGIEDVPGRHIVIIDDLIQSGGTMINCKNLLVSAGAAAVSGYVTHGVFPSQSWKRFLNTKNDELGESSWKHFWITNSISHTAEEVKGQAPFEVLSLAPRVVAMFAEKK